MKFRDIKEPLHPSSRDLAQRFHMSLTERDIDGLNEDLLD